MGKKTALRLLLTGILNCGCLFVFAQEQKNSPGGGLDEVMRSHNKIYVVMAVCVTILTGLILYLVRIDRKVGRKEKGGFL